MPVPQAIDNIAGVIAQNLTGLEATVQKEVDERLLSLDPSPLREHLGGNALLGVSTAVCRAAALSQKIPLYQYIAQLSGTATLGSTLPVPLFNILNGGAHADNNLSFQEFMVIPLAKELNFLQMMEAGRKVFNQLKENLKNLHQSTAYGEEGGFAPRLNSNDEAIELLVEAIQEAGFVPGQQVGIGIDIAASNISDLNSASYPKDIMTYYRDLASNYPLVMLEDPFSDKDWPDWIKLTQALGSRLALVGDDLFSTNCQRLKEGIDSHAGNGISVKPNQAGTITETLNAINLAKSAGFSVQISHRAGETEDTFIADLAVGTAAPYLKAGAPNRGERIAKYNRVLRIARALGKI